MNIQDIAALVAIRNYVVTVREDRNVFKGNDYHAVTARVQKIDSFLASVIKEVDLINLAQNPPQVEAPVPKTRASKKEQKKPAPIKKAEQVSDSQIPLAFDKVSSDKEDLSDDDDASLIAKTIAKEKAKIQSRKSK